MKFLYLIILILATYNLCLSQDTIWFLSGERLVTSNYSFNEENGMLTFKKGKKEKKVGLEYVFSIKEKNGYEKVFYEPTSIDKVPFSVEQMRSFIKGEFEASENYKATGATISGFISGCGGLYVSPLINIPVFWSPVFPTAYSAIIGSTNIKINKIEKRYPQFSNDDYFISGYSEVVKQKRISHSIVGGIIGLVVGITSAKLLIK